MLEEGEKRDTNQSELQLLSTRDRKERGPTTFLQAGMLSRPPGNDHEVGSGMVTWLRDSPYLALLFPQPFFWAVLRHRCDALSTAVP